jgi:hypothetical protein
MNLELMNSRKGHIEIKRYSLKPLSIRKLYRFGISNLIRLFYGITDDFTGKFSNKNLDR